jgi:hypothetical protein
VALALVIALGVATLLTPVFVTPFIVLLGRACSSRSRCWWRLPRLAVAPALAAAMAGAGAGRGVRHAGGHAHRLSRLGGRRHRCDAHPERVAGFVWTTGSGLMVGLVLALGALYRERDAQARAQELQFALERETLERQALDAGCRCCIPRSSRTSCSTRWPTCRSWSSPARRERPRCCAASSPTCARRCRGCRRGATLGDEESLVRAYLELMLMRMPDRLRFDVRVDRRCAACAFPRWRCSRWWRTPCAMASTRASTVASIEVRAEREATARAGVGERHRVGMSEAAQPGTGSRTCARACRRSSAHRRHWSSASRRQRPPAQLAFRPMP